jgi:DNA-binding transcriptional ArsR family regulator
VTNPVAPPSLTIDKPEQLKALGHPLRLKVLQVLGSTDDAMTNRDLAERLEVDPGHLHFHVRMLHKAGLIELADGATGREKPYRVVAKVLEVGPEIRAAGLATDLQSAQLRELMRGFELFSKQGRFRTTQVHVKIDAETLWEIVNETVDRLAAAEDESQPSQTLTIGGHPTIDRGEE